MSKGHIMHEEFTELMIKISSELASLNTNMTNVLDKLTNHESRLTNLENSKSTIKDGIMKWLVMALIGTISVIASLTGAGGILKLLIQN